MKVKDEDQWQKNRRNSPEMWARRPRWRRQKYTKHHKNNSILSQTTDNTSMTKILQKQNPFVNYTFYDDVTLHSFIHQLPSDLNDVKIKNLLSCNLLTPCIINKNTEKKQNQMEINILPNETHEPILHTKTTQSTGTCCALSLDNKYCGLPSYCDKNNLTGDSIMHAEEFICQTPLDTEHNYDIDVTIMGETNNSFIKIFCDDNSNINNDELAISVTDLSSVDSVTEQINIYLKKVNSAVQPMILDEFSCVKHDKKNSEIIFVYIDDKTANVQEFSCDKTSKTFVNVATSMEAVCCCRKNPQPRYVLPACIVKDVAQLPQNKNDPWIRVLEKVKVTRSNCHLTTNETSNIESSSSMTVTTVDTDTTGSTTSSSTSLDELELSHNYYDDDHVNYQNSTSLKFISLLPPLISKEICRWHEQKKQIQKH